MRRTKKTRFIPPDAVLQDNDGTDAVIYFYSLGTDKYVLLAFHGKAANPDIHVSYRASVDRDARAKQFIESRRAHTKAKAARKAAARKPHDLKAGGILCSLWGHDQTNVDFYVIIKATAHTVDLQKIGSRVTRETGWASCMVVPSRKHKIGAVMQRKRVGPNGTVRVQNWGVYASPWSGQEINQTNYA